MTDKNKQADERTPFDAAIDATYPIPDSPHTSVVQRAIDNRIAFRFGWEQACAALAQQAWVSSTTTASASGDFHRCDLTDYKTPVSYSNGTGRAPAPSREAAPLEFDAWWKSEIEANGGTSIGADFRHWAGRGYRAALAQQGAGAAAEDADTLNVMLWLLRRLPRAYENPPFVVQTVQRLAEGTGTDVSECLNERAAHPGDAAEGGRVGAA